MNERDRALMEAHQIAAENDYFAARPQLDSKLMRSIFTAGFGHGWNLVPHEPPNSGIANMLFDVKKPVFLVKFWYADETEVPCTACNKALFYINPNGIFCYFCGKKYL